MDNKKAAALKYDMKSYNAPKMVARGEKFMAEKIIDIAKKNNIPIKEDKDMIEILSKLEINQEIPPELYKAVAEIFRFIYNISREENDATKN